MAFSELGVWSGVAALRARRLIHPLLAASLRCRFAAPLRVLRADAARAMALRALVSRPLTVAI